MKRLITLFFFIIPIVVFSQTSINSYIDLAVQMSFEEEGSGFFNDVRSFSFNEDGSSVRPTNPNFTLLDMSVFNSYNSGLPYGMNDESLWQGKGINTFITGGFKTQYGAFSVIVYPEFWFSQNSDFSLTPAGADFSSEFASYMNRIDNPQRFGDKPLFEARMGQSEVRYTGEKLTVGIGTQSLWLGPGIHNALILSNNAGGFPKIDLGMRDINTLFGEFEFFLWWGLLEESEYFDQLPENDQTLFNGMHISYRPSFIPNFVFGFNRTLTTDFSTAGFSSYSTLFIPFMSNLFGEDENDQRASITFEWTYPEVGFSAYGEWARNDYQPMLRSILQFPQHTQAYTLGVKQRIFKNRERSAVFSFETTNILVSWDYTIEGSPGASFYTHSIVRQGYTNNGQVLGAGIGTGSGSQTFQLAFLYKKGLLSGYLQRVAVNQDYLYTFPPGSEQRDSSYGETHLTAGVKWSHEVVQNQQLLFGIDYTRVLNRNYIKKNDINNFRLEAGYTLSF